MLTDSLRARLLKLNTTLLCDVGTDKVLLLNPSIQLRSQAKCMVGVAYTVASEEHLLAVMQSLKEAHEHDVLVIDCANSPLAFGGELFSMEASRKKLAGIVINGACRDIEALESMTLPIFSKSICARRAGMTHLGKTQVVLQWDNVAIAPGDIIVGDKNGIVLMKPADLEEITSAAEDILRKENIIVSKMKNENKSLFDVIHELVK